MTLGEKLQALRRARGWTQEQLAEELGVSRQALSKWELNAAVPDTENVVRLSRLFGVTTDYLLVGEEGVPTAKTGEGPTHPTAKGKEVWAWLLMIFSTLGVTGLKLWHSLSPVYTGSVSEVGETGIETVVSADRLVNFWEFLAAQRITWLFCLLVVLFLVGAVGVLRVRLQRRKSSQGSFPSA